MVDIDADDQENPFCCAEYAEEIYRYLRKREVGGNPLVKARGGFYEGD